PPGRSFFFQAEDGIRDLIVTGVQTCALPIYVRKATGRKARRDGKILRRERRDRVGQPDSQLRVPAVPDGERFAYRPPNQRHPRRSEERRVGKECRSRRAPDHKKKKYNQLMRT